MWRRLPEPLLASAPAPRSGSWSWPPAWWGSLCLLSERPAVAASPVDEPLVRWFDWLHWQTAVGVFRA